LRLLKDENERARLGAQARSVALSRFHLEQMVDATERVYLETMNDER
jgi:hypothetical protein